MVILNPELYLLFHKINCCKSSFTENKVSTIFYKRYIHIYIILMHFILYHPLNLPITVNFISFCAMAGPET